MSTVHISGHPLVKSVIVEVDEDGFTQLVSFDDASRILDAWVAAPAVDALGEDTEWLRAYEWSEDAAKFVTALAGDGEITIDWWSEYENGLFDLQSMPFDFEIWEEPETPDPDGLTVRLLTVDTQVAETRAYGDHEQDLAYEWYDRFVAGLPVGYTAQLFNTGTGDMLAETTRA